MRYPRENRRFIEAGLLLRTIKDDPDRLDLVLELQRIIIRRISGCEKRIKHLQKARFRVKRLKSIGRHPKQKSNILKALIVSIDARIQDIQHLMFLWRCYGDGIAASYQSKYALKHLLYDDNYNIKQDAGAIRGKKGFRLEYKMLRMGIRMNVPVVMSDLTNIIRHGDICALAGKDPVAIEMKSSSRLSKRARRQIEQLRSIAEFYHNDGASNFRGIPNVKRVALVNDEVNYELVINNCIEEANETGVSVAAPERGITYFACRHDISFDSEKLHELIGGVSRTSLFVALTPDESWLPLYPFTLSMNAKNLVLFMQEVIYVAVLIDLQIVKELFAQRGFSATALMDGVHSFQISVDPKNFDEGVARVSEQFFLRIALEFQSLTWFVEEQTANIFPAIGESVDVQNTSAYFEIPDDWYTVKDCFSE